MKPGCELGSQKSIRAFRAGRSVLVLVEGELPTPGYKVDIEQSPLRIFPPQFNLVRCPLPGVWPDVVTPYGYAETVPFPPDHKQITIHHAGGAAEVQIERLVKELEAYGRAVGEETPHPCPPGADEATGFSKDLSFDEAFADALSNLPPLNLPGADRMVRIEVAEIGALFGGIAGFHDLTVRVCRTHG